MQEKPRGKEQPQPGGLCVCVCVCVRERERAALLSFKILAAKSSKEVMRFPPSLPSCSPSEVTPLPSMPQGVICSNQERSVLQFKASPW